MEAFAFACGLSGKKNGAEDGGMWGRDGRRGSDGESAGAGNGGARGDPLFWSRFPNVFLPE